MRQWGLNRKLSTIFSIHLVEHELKDVCGEVANVGHGGGHVVLGALFSKKSYLEWHFI